MPREAEEQIWLMNWSTLMRKRYPELDLLYHVPNGGSRNRAEAANLKRQGVKAGVPDLCLPVSRGGYHGLYIEMKVGKNKPTQKQEEWLAALRRGGYAAEMCYGWQAAAEVIETYLRMKDKK